MKWTKCCLTIVLIAFAASQSLVAQQSASPGLPESNSFLDISFAKEKTFIDDIRPDEIRVENDTGRKITAINDIGELPLRIVLLIDTSRSQLNNLPKLFHPLLRETIESLQLRSVDSVCLIGFNDIIYLIQDFTSDKTLLLKDIDPLRAGGGTRLFDSLFFAGKGLSNKSDYRKAILVFSDGEDIDSDQPILEAYREAVKNNVRVYLLRPLDVSNQFFSPMRPKFLAKHQKYVPMTGGKIFSFSDLRSGKVSVKQILDELSHLKRISITPPTQSNSKIKLSVSRKGIKAYYPQALTVERVK